mgnify:CR=1 FL=1
MPSGVRVQVPSPVRLNSPPDKDLRELCSLAARVRALIGPLLSRNQRRFGFGSPRASERTHSGDVAEDSVEVGDAHPDEALAESGGGELAVSDAQGAVLDGSRA